MALEIEATYENGVFKPDEEPPLQNGQRVKLTLQTPGSAVARLYGRIPWPGNTEELDRLLGDPDEGQWSGNDV